MTSIVRRNDEQGVVGDEIRGKTGRKHNVEKCRKSLMNVNSIFLTKLLYF